VVNVCVCVRACVCVCVCVWGWFIHKVAGTWLVHAYIDGRVVVLYLQSRVSGCFIDRDTGTLLVSTYWDVFVVGL
jgi:hypothetical protein